jgi:hypothetical protein
MGDPLELEPVEAEVDAALSLREPLARAEALKAETAELGVQIEEHRRMLSSKTYSATTSQGSVPRPGGR